MVRVGRMDLKSQTLSGVYEAWQGIAPRTVALSRLSGLGGEIASPMRTTKLNLRTQLRNEPALPALSGDVSGGPARNRLK